MAEGPFYIVALLTVSIPIVFLTIFGNVLVLLSWCFVKEIRQPKNLNFISLALVDLLTGLIVLPLNCMYAYEERWSSGLIACAIWNSAYYAFPSISAYHLVAIAWDRYRILSEGVGYIQKRTMSSVASKLVGIWMIGPLVLMPLWLEWDHRNQDPKVENTCLTIQTPFWCTHVFVTSILIPAVLLIRLYSFVLSEVKKRRNKRRTMAPKLSDETEGSSGNPPSNASLTPLKHKDPKKERSVAFTVGMICATFFICWTPWYSCFLFSAFAPPHLLPSAALLTWTAIFGLANSCVNPIFYAARIPEFQMALKKILRCGF